MSETLVTTTLDSEFRPGEHRPDTSEDADGPEAVPEWYRETLDLIISNADVVGPCKWMGGEKVRLGTAMWKHERPTLENVHVVHANVVEFLANADVKTPEEENESEKNESQAADTEEMDVPEASAVAEREETAQISAAGRENQKAPGSRDVSEGRNQPTDTTDAWRQEPSYSAMTEISEVKAVRMTDAPAQTAADSRAGPPKPTGSEANSAPEHKVVEKKPAEILIPQSPTEKTVLETTQTATPTEAKPAEPAQVSKVKVDELSLAPDNEILSLQILEEVGTEKLIDDDQTEIISLIDFDGQEILIDHFAEIETEADDTQNLLLEEPETDLADFTVEAAGEESFFEKANEPAFSEPMELTVPEQLTDVSLTIDEIEGSLTGLAEKLQASEPEKVETVERILNKIIEVPAKVSGENDEEIIVTEAEAQEELEQLFAELFESLDIEYTTKLVESLAQLTLKRHLADKLKELKNEEEAAEISQNTAVQRLIKRLLAALNAVKKAILHAGAVGRSALQLYNLGFAV